MPEYSLNHLHHETTDVDATVTWYQVNFDAAITARFERDGVEWARLALGGITMNVTDRAQTEVPLGPYRGLDHFALATTDLDESLAGMTRNGVTVLAQPRSPRPGLRIAFVAGPDNVKIELMEVRDPA